MIGTNYDIELHYRVVIDTLKGVSGERKCYRMIGGVLIERTVADVLPDLAGNIEQVSKNTGYDRYNTNFLYVLVSPAQKCRRSLK